MTYLHCAPVATSNSSTCGRVKLLHLDWRNEGTLSGYRALVQARCKSFPRRRARGARHAYTRAARWETRLEGTMFATAAARGSTGWIMRVWQLAPRPL